MTTPKPALPEPVALIDPRALARGDASLHCITRPEYRSIADADAGVEYVPVYTRAAIDAAVAEARAGLERECDDTDKLLRGLGLDPERCRTEGGALNVGKTLALLAEARAVPTDFQLEQLFDAVHEHVEFGREFREHARRLLSATTSPEPAMPAESGLNLADPAVQKRLAAQWGFVPAERVALSEERAKRLWADACDRGVVSMVAGQWLIRAVEAAHGITPSQGKGEQG